MEKGHLQNSDPRPKRRIDKDNPYRIFTVGIETGKPRYFVRFKDGNGPEHCLEVEERLFNAFDQFELDDLSYMNEVDNNHERSVLSEASLNKRAFASSKETEEMAFSDLRNEALHNAIMRLPEVQRRRLILYYFGGLTQQQIADIEGCGRERVRKSIAAAKSFLKKFLVKGGFFEV